MRVSWFVVLLSRFIVGRGSTSAAELIDTSVSTLLRDDHDADASERAARQLMDLAYECPENVQSIMRSGALEPLVRLLGGGGPGAREAAAGALIDLSQTDADRIAVVRAGAIAPSVELLAVPEASCREAAAGLLTTLVVVARGAVVGPLVKAVAANPGNGTKARNAAWTLAKLAGDHADHRMALAIARAGAAEPLVDLLRSRVAAGAAARPSRSSRRRDAREFVDHGAGAALGAALDGRRDGATEARAVGALAALLQARQDAATAKTPTKASFETAELRAALAAAEADAARDRSALARARGPRGERREADAARFDAEREALAAALADAGTRAAERERAADVRERAADVLIDEHVAQCARLEKAKAELEASAARCAALAAENANLAERAQPGRA
ncbi:hypothetical protein JL720_1686 [Aureococcus anophagefferens]|nr:hypothetical protein JL720_1686 [Aureococcus anophagefferens]